MAYMTGLQQSTDTPLVTTQVIDTHAPAVTTPSLKVLTLNIAHGRGAALNQIFLNRKAFDANLEAISDTIRQTSADIVALQEVDNSSLWSGRFDHAEHIALQPVTAGERMRGTPAAGCSILEQRSCPGSPLLRPMPVNSPRPHRHYARVL